MSASEQIIISDIGIQPVTVVDSSILGIDNTPTQLVTTIESAQVVVGDKNIQLLVSDSQSIAVVEEIGKQILSVGTQGPAGPPGIGTASILSLEAGENLSVGDPVYVSANKFYKASSVVSFGVIGIISIGAAITALATATLSGIVSLSGLIDGGVYFLSTGVISTVVPVSGYVVRMGKALSTASLLLNIEEPVLLN